MTLQLDERENLNHGNYLKDLEDLPLGSYTSYYKKMVPPKNVLSTLDSQAPSTSTQGTSVSVKKYRVKKYRVPLENKLAILSLIKEKKGTLFGQFSTEIENATKVAAWNQVKLKAQSLGACTPDRDWKWVRDSLFGVWKTRSMAKKDNSKKTGAPGGKKRLPDEADEMIYDIIGKDSPIIEGLPIRESGSLESDHENEDFFGSMIVDIIPTPVSPPKKKKKRVEYTDILKTKRELQVSLLEMENYKQRLEIFKLEKELNLPHGPFTKHLNQREPEILQVVFHKE